MTVRSNSTNWSSPRQAELNVLKRLQAESRRGLHSPLDALLEQQLKIDAPLFILSPIETERKAAILDRAFKGEL